jgi:hypothetical protein
MNIKQIISALTAGFMMALAVPAFAFAAPTTEVVLESDVTRQAENTSPTNKWVVYTRAGTPSTAAVFRNGPAMPPLGTGSLELTTVSGTDKVFAFNYDHVGAKLADVNDISYNTFRTAGSAQQLAALNVVIDSNGPAVAGGFTTLVFEPVYNTDQGAVNNGVWQNWNAGNNTIWWSSRPINGAPNRDTFVTLASIKQANPDATIEGVGVNQGSGNPGLTTAVDAFTFDKVTYNFEQKPVKATSKDDCKNDGYKNFQTSYKNQGDCVSSVASNGKAKGNPSVVESLTTTVRELFN